MLKERPGLWIVGLFVLKVALHLPFLSDPYGHSKIERSWESQIVCDFTGQIIKNWERAGFWAEGGQPLGRYLPSEPPEKFPYLHHPPGAFWLFHGTTRITGVDTWGLRLVAVLFSALGVAFLCGFLWRAVGPSVAVLASAFLCASPMDFWYGRMASYEPLVLTSILAALFFRRRGCWVSLTVALILGGWADWIAYPGWLVLVIHELALPKSERRWKALFFVGCALFASLVGSVALLAHWSVEAGREPLSFLSAGEHAAGLDWSLGVGAVLGGIFRPLRDLFGWPFLAVATIGSACLLWQRRQASVLVWCALALVPVVNVLLFPRRAFNHEFWWFYVSPVLAFGAAWCVVLLGRRSRLLAACLLLALLAHQGWMITNLRANRVTDRAHREAEGFNRLLGKDDILICPKHLFAQRFYGHFLLYDQIDSEAGLQVFLKRRLDGHLPRGRMVFLLPNDSPLMATETIKQIAEMSSRLPLGPTTAFVLD